MHSESIGRHNSFRTVFMGGIACGPKGRLMFICYLIAIFYFFFRFTVLSFSTYCYAPLTIPTSTNRMDSFYSIKVV